MPPGPEETGDSLWKDQRNHDLAVRRTAVPVQPNTAGFALRLTPPLILFACFFFNVASDASTCNWRALLVEPKGEDLHMHSLVLQLKIWQLRLENGSYLPPKIPTGNGGSNKHSQGITMEAVGVAIGSVSLAIQFYQVGKGAFRLLSGIKATSGDSRLLKTLIKVQRQRYSARAKCVTPNHLHIIPPYYT